jgi:hypothetical protein
MMKYYIFMLISQASLWFMAGLKFQRGCYFDSLERVSIALIMSVLVAAMFAMATEEADDSEKKDPPQNQK